jgi:hypothetical protein
VGSGSKRHLQSLHATGLATMLQITLKPPHEHKTIIQTNGKASTCVPWSLLRRRAILWTCMNSNDEHCAVPPVDLVSDGLAFSASYGQCHRRGPLNHGCCRYLMMTWAAHVFFLLLLQQEHTLEPAILVQHSRTVPWVVLNLDLRRYSSSIIAYPNLLPLSLYRNHLLHHFLMAGLLASTSAAMASKN